MFKPKRDKISFLISIILLVFFTILILFLRLSYGNSIISFNIILKVLFSKNSQIENQTIYTVIKNIRLPSFISAFTIGSILAISGLVMQLILKNPLAEPYTLGISAGASFGCSLAIFLSGIVPYFSVTILMLTPFFAVSFGIFSAILIFVIALKTKSYSSSSLIISGIIVNSFFTACITILFYLLGQKVNLALSWMMGLIPLADKNWIFLILFEIFLFIIYFSFHKEFDIISITESSSTGIGLNTARFKQIFFLISAIGVSLIVAQSGIIPFIGIIVPYLLKLNHENHFKQNLVYSLFFGGNFLVIIDMLTYLIPSIFKSNIQIPVGAVTGFLGSPFFLFLLTRRKFK